jgi:beta-glucanase (GH16 family)
MRLVFLLLLVLIPAAAEDSWKLVWNDEFKGRANSAPNPAKWNCDLGAGGWGNNELETYTNAIENAFLDGRGHLVIRVLKTADGYTSARLKTLEKFSFLYGKVEARIRIPRGQGIWPAFWMLAANRSLVGWRNSGEIDIMENIGREPSRVHATVHGPGYSGDNGIGGIVPLPGDRAFADDFHTFAIVWRKESIELFVDGKSHAKVTQAALPANATWVFDTPFYMLLNVAVGGRWPGAPDATSTYPQTMTVDYVRVYQQGR